MAQRKSNTKAGNSKAKSRAAEANEAQGATEDAAEDAPNEDPSEDQVVEKDLRQQYRLGGKHYGPGKTMMPKHLADLVNGEPPATKEDQE